jgi:hypothetical protein
MKIKFTSITVQSKKKYIPFWLRERVDGEEFLDKGHSTTAI